MIFYTYAGDGKPESVADPALAPHTGEWVAQNGPDKFLGSDLEQRLKARGIKTVIVTGTSAQGVVIGTGKAGRATRGYKVINWSTACRPRTPTWNSTRPGTCTKAARRS